MDVQRLPTKQDSKKIIETMESVIESVKKKRKFRKKIHHHHHHRHHHENNNAEGIEQAEILIISDAITHNLSIISPNTSLDESAKAATVKNRNESLSKENNNSQNLIKNMKKRKERKNSLENSRNRAKSNESPLTREPRADEDSENCETETSSVSVSKKVNAFELMMNARNRSIGSNSPGRDLSEDVEASEEKASKEILSKRKQMLKQWSEKKGGLKRKMEEEAREEYIELQMEKRAKKLKRMLCNGSDTPSIQSATKKQGMDLPSNVVGLRQKRRSKRNGAENVDSVEQQRDNSTKNQKSANDVFSSTPKTTKHRKSETEVIELDSTYEETHPNTENNAQISLDPEFDGILSSPIKKRDSLLGYFPKIFSPNTTKDDVPVQLILNSSDDFVNTKKKSSRKSKVEFSQQTQADNIPQEKPSKRARKSRTSTRVKSNEDVKGELKDVTVAQQRPITPSNGICVGQEEIAVNEYQTPTTQSGRPRRSCVGKIRYDFDTSPIKLETKSRKRERRNSKTEDIYLPSSSVSKPIKPNSLSESVISVDDDEHSSLLNAKEKIPMKLAPIFMKSLPKPAIDPEILKARQQFLMSGVPEKMRLEIEKQKQFEQNYEIFTEEFPITGHYHQFNSGSIDDDGYGSQTPDAINWKKFGIKWRSLNEENSSSKSQRNFKFMKNEKHVLSPLQKLQKIDNKQKFIKHLKNVYDKFPTYKCYNQLREKYRYFSAIDTNFGETHQITDSLVVTKITNRCKTKIQGQLNDDDVKPPPTAPNGELLFTEKYKPILSEQVLVNLTPVSRLKEFLASWQNRKSCKLDTSMSDFEYANDSSGSNAANHNTVVLVGPCSSGKTNALFAIANELNFNVLEINAGMKRTGKKILLELQEATQSHQVGKDGGNLFKQTLNGIKKKSQFSDSSTSFENNSNEKLSLILIEDADILFEQDNGFIDAINQLSSISKRPVVITSNNRDCQHLLKLINQHSIDFTPPNVLNISKFLSILSLIENCPIELDDIVSLYLFNGKNVRKTLLEMQFFIQSGGDRKKVYQKNDTKQPTFISSPRKFSIEESEDSVQENKSITMTAERCDDAEKDEQNVYIHRTLFDFYTTNQNMNLRIPLPMNYNLLWSNLKDIFSVSKNLRNDIEFSSKLMKMKKQQNPKRLIKGNNNDGDSILNSLSQFYENISIATHIPTKTHDIGEYQNLSEEISHNLTELAIDVNLNAEMTAYNLFETTTERLHLTPYISSNQMTRTKRSLSLDYESCLRSICRSEKSRLQKERRGSRFYHYLRNVCTANLDSFSGNVFEKSCEIFSNENNNCNDLKVQE